MKTWTTFDFGAARARLAKMTPQELSEFDQKVRAALKPVPQNPVPQKFWTPWYWAGLHDEIWRSK